MENYSKEYLRRCQKQLESWNAPLSEWERKRVYDVRDDDKDAPLHKCELCGCENVRYVHVMDHQFYFEEVFVGCICAGVMQDDILKAQECERRVKNRTRRRKNYLKKQWTEIDRGVYARQFRLEYKGKELFIKITSRNLHWAFCDGRSVCRYKGRPIDNFYAAVYAAFDLADPVEDIL